MKDYFVKLFNYENRANKIITDLLLSVNDPPDKSMSLMSHIINAQIVWLGRIKSEPCGTAVWKAYSKTEIQETLLKSSSDITDYINNVSEDDLKNVIYYTNTKGDNFNSVLEDILTHMTHHSAYHRGQIVQLLKNIVTTIPYTDYIHYIRTVNSE